jgi:hypothetical protein
MNSELFNLWLFLLAIAKAALLTGFGPALIFAVLSEKFRIVKFGIESSRGGQLATEKRFDASKFGSRQQARPRKVWRSA